ncbi:hypothetical protein OG320_18975 [Microbispora sp. NBC_01189]|uniref:hypothetical protein n=1 Tax=Microbispora sp. NBC_01189 TaxID=2903583 RepID=UPI002E0D8DAE|nr:hypothetical protein OG320_18975 [Microbispora sp. NBC_01189]
MTRPALATAAATLLVSACALLTSACSAPGADHGFTPGGGAKAPAAAAGATTGVTGDDTADGTGDGVVTAAPGLRVEIEWPGGLDPVRSAVVKAFADDFAAQWRAVGTSGADRSYTKGLHPESSAYRDADKWVHGFLKDGRSARGVAKIYSMTVPAIMGRGAEANACVDLTGVRLTDEEGTPLAAQPGWVKRPRAVFLQNAGLRRGDDGAWRIAMYHHADYPDERAKECIR